MTNSPHVCPKDHVDGAESDAATDTSRPRRRSAWGGRMINLWRGLRAGHGIACAACQWWLPAFAVMLIPVLSTTVAAQEVLAGTIRDSLTGAPVRGAVVMLFGERDTVARVLTAADGTYRLSGAGASRVRVVRIGYAPHDVDLRSLLHTSADISLVPLGRRLPAVSVRASQLCPRRPDQAEALALWAAAADGLLALAVASSEATVSDTVTQIRFVRLVDGTGSRVRSQTVEHVVTGNAAPIRADRAPEDFATTGYLLRSPSTTTFLGPDPIVLLHPTFAETHCLSVRHDPRRHVGQVGVAFAPVRGRTGIPDIEGVLWLKDNPLALESLDFTYRGVDKVVRDVQAGGRLEFETLTNGLPLIQYWHIRSPQMVYLPAGRSVQGGRVEVTGDVPSVVAVNETGGLVESGHLSDGTSWAARLATWNGRVLNDRSDDPVPGAVITLDSTDYLATTDSNGRFAFTRLLPGPYVARVRDSVHVMAGFADSGVLIPRHAVVQQTVTRESSVRLDVALQRTLRTDLRLPWRSPVPGCGNNSPAQPRFTVAGSVMTPDSLPVPMAAIRLSWGESGRDRNASTVIEARTDAEGFFLVCGVVGDRALDALVVSAEGHAYRGTTTVPAVDYDERGRKRMNNIRRIILVVRPGAGGP